MYNSYPASQLQGVIRNIWHLINVKLFLCHNFGTFFNSNLNATANIYYVKFEIISDDDCTVDVPSLSPHLSKALMTAIIAHAQAKHKTKNYLFSGFMNKQCH